MTRFPAAMLAGAIALSAAQTLAQTQTTPPPVPRPFPGPATAGGGTAPATQTTGKVPPAKIETAQAPPAGSLDAYVFPGSEFLDSFDAGRGQQRYYLYGTNTPYADVVAYYKDSIKAGNREIARTPAIYQFDLGRFQDETMAYPPSVVVKDYTWNNSAGYLHVAGTTEKRFRTIVQIVPPGPAR